MFVIPFLDDNHNLSFDEVDDTFLTLMKFTLYQKALYKSKQFVKDPFLFFKLSPRNRRIQYLLGK